MENLDFRAIAYRLWRLRRLIGVASLLPLPGIMLSEIFGFGLAFGGGGGVVLFLWIIVVLTLAVRFPNGWIDHFALGLPLGAITLVSPFAILFGVGPAVGILLGTALMAGGWFWVNSSLPVMLSEIPMGTNSQTFQASVNLPAPLLKEALFLRPSARCGLHACGPANAEGIFEVKAFGYRLLDNDLEIEDGELSFFAKVVESDDNSQVTQYFLTDDGVTASTVYEEITPRQRGCLYAKQEVLDHFSLLAALGFWLNDAEADHLVATLDLFAEAPPRALKLMPQESLLSWIAQRMMRRMTRNTGDAA